MIDRLIEASDLGPLPWQATLFAPRDAKACSPYVVIAERPAEAADRKGSGHWVDDLIIGIERSANGTVVERTSPYATRVHMPGLEGSGEVVRIKNDPP